jgi:hypothetical protein
LIASAETGEGVAVMINANDNSRLMGRIRDYVERAWGFTVTSPTSPPATTTAVPIDRSRLVRYGGYYEVSDNNMVAIAPHPVASGMQVLIDALPDETLLAMDSTSFGSTERPFRVGFFMDSRGAVSGAAMFPGTPRERKAARVAPLPSTLNPTTDPDPALAKRIVDALDAIRQGGDRLASATDLTAGAKKDFGQGRADPALGGAATALYLGEEDVSGRGIRRHGG